MSLKKYKHKVTGVIIEGEEGASWYRSSKYALPGWLVMQSNDWEEIPQFQLKTEDGVVLTNELDQVFYLYISEDKWLTGVWTAKGAARSDSYSKDKLFFSSLSARDKYIAENKPLFSLNEIVDYIYEEWNSDVPIPRNMIMNGSLLKKKAYERIKKTP